MTISHPTYSFKAFLVEALYGLYPRAEGRRTTVAQNDIKALFSVQERRTDIDH